MCYIIVESDTTEAAREGGLFVSTGREKGMEPRYLIITYSTWHEDDLGPVLVYTYNYIQFYKVGEPCGQPFHMIGYEILRYLSVGVPEAVTVRRFYEGYTPPLEMSLAA